MAIDTHGKRRSAIAAGIAALVLLPVPDGTVGTQDRPHAAGLYAGITIGAPAVLAVGLVTVVDARAATAVIKARDGTTTVDARGRTVIVKRRT